MKTIQLIFIGLFFGLLPIQSQEYLRMIDTSTYSVEEIRKNAELYFADKEKGRGSGYKQYKRWEYMAQRLMNEKGYAPSITQRIEELEKHNSYLNENGVNKVSLNDYWSELGPLDWNATSGWNPGVGRITSIAIDTSNSNHIIIGANTGGVWKTIDGGANWTTLSDYFSNLYVYSVAIDPLNSNTYYFGSYNGLIYKSMDAGATWNALGNTGGNSKVNKILLHPSNSTILFASIENNGIYKSIDSGATWTRVISGYGYDIEFVPNNANVVYASGHGFHKSTDGGSTFSTISGFNNGAKMIGVSPNNPRIVYVVDADNNEFGGFYKSTDSGVSFTEMGHTSRNFFGYDTSGYNSGGQAPRDMDIAVNPNNVNEIHIAGILTWRSIDGGNNFTITSDWTPSNASSANIGYCHADVDIMEFDGDTLFIGSDGGIFKAINTNTIDSNYYTDITAGIGIRQFYKIGISQSSSVIVSGGSQDNGTSFYKQATGWKDWLGADGMETFIDKDNNNTMYGTSQFGQLYRSDNGGNSYVGLNEPGSGSGEWVTPFEQDPTTTNVIYLGYSNVYKSTNKGSTWSSISQNFGANLDHLKIDPSNNMVMYAAEYFKLYKTTDGGATNWTQITTPGGSINSIAIHPTNPNKVAVATTSTNKVLVSSDGGITWVNYKKNLPAFSALALVWDDNGEDGLYLGMDYGIFYIDNTFTDWQPYNNNLPNVIINELEINNVDNKIYAASYGRGLWASPLVITAIGVESFLSVDNVFIYPNPATETIHLMFKDMVEADLRIFDTSGKLIIYLPNVLLKDEYTIDISKLNTGLFFLRINSDKGVLTKKIFKK